MSDELLAEVRALRSTMNDALDGLERRIRSMVAASGAQPPPAPANDDRLPAVWLSLKTFQQITRIADRKTAIERIVEFGLGRKNGGRWEVDPRRLEAWRDGRDYEPIKGVRP